MTSAKCGGLVASGLLLIACTTAQNPSTSTWHSTLDDMFAQYATLAMFDGTVLVDLSGEIEYEHSFGRASYELDTAHERDTRFRIASVSKDLTDAALGVLMSRGVLTLDTPIAKYLPDFPSADTITLRHIIEFSSGIAHTNTQPWGHGDVALSRDELLRRLQALPLDFEPGTDRRYSNGGYAVLAHIIGTATGSDYAHAMRTLVFEPLNMYNTGDITHSRNVIEGIAVGYEPGPVAGTRRHPRPYAVEMRPGGGSLYSTARDLRTFYRALLENNLFDESIRRELFGDSGVIDTTGRSPGFSSQVRMDTKTNSIVVILGNNYAFAQNLARYAHDLATDKPEFELWPPLLPATAAIAVDDPRIGRYRWPDFIDAEGDVYLTSAGNLAFVDVENDYESALVQLADGSLLFTMYHFRCTGAADIARDLSCTPLSGNERAKMRLTFVAH